MTRAREDRVELEVGGRQLTRWVSYRVDSDLLNPADAFSLEVDVPVNDTEGVLDLVRPGASFKLYVIRRRGGQERRSLQMTGTIEGRDMGVSKRGGIRVQVTGRDRAGLLVDANVQPGIICDGHTDRLLDLLTNAVEPYGIEVIADDTAERSILTGERRRAPRTALERREARAAGVPPGRYSRTRLEAARAAGTPLDEALGVTADSGARFAAGVPPSEIERMTVREARPNPGETIWDYFTRHLRRFGLMMWFTADGKLVVGSPDWSQEPIYRFIRRPRPSADDPNTILDGGIKETILNSYSSVTVSGRAVVADGQRTRIRETVENPDWPEDAPPKPRYLNDPTIRDADAARRRALRELLSGRAKQLTLTYTVDGHGQGDYLWAAGSTGYVLDERLGVDDVFFVLGRELQGGFSDGSQVQVRLIPLRSFEV